MWTLSLRLLGGAASALDLEGAFFAGPYRVPRECDCDPPITTDSSYWLSLGLGWNIRLGGPIYLRLSAAWAQMLNGEALECVGESCPPDGAYDDHAAILLGLALGARF
jgi:hypothetical protein